jgi:hypothetical protein
MDCTGTGSYYSLALGASWIITEMQKSTRQVVINLSLQANSNAIEDLIMNNLYKTGAVVVVAAGKLTLVNLP